MSSLSAAVHENILELVHFLDLLFTHCLAQGVALAAGKAAEQSRQKHHLFLVHSDAVGVREVFLHLGDVVGYGMSAVFALDELGYVLHRPRAVEGVHGDEILEHGGFELAQVALHAGTFELECAHGGAAAVEFVGGFVVERNGVHVDVDAAVCLDIGHGVADDRQRFQPEEVHFYEAGALDNAAFVLCHQNAVAVLVLGCAHGHPVGDVVAAYNHTACVHTGVAHCTLEFAGIFHNLRHFGVGHGLLEVVDIVDEVAHRLFQLLFLLWVARVDGHVVGHKPGEGVALVDGVAHHARHVLDGRFGCHGAVCDDVRHIGCAVALGHVVEHILAAVVVEVDVDVGERYAVGVEEAFEQEIVFQRVDLCYSQAVCHYGAGRGPTPRADAHAHGPSLAYEVFHDEEVAGEAHGLHYVQLEAYAFLHFRRQYFAVAAVRALECYLGKVVGLEFYAVQFVVATESLYFFLGGLARKHRVSVLIAGELGKKLLFGYAAAVFLLGAELGGYGVEGHDGSMLDAVFLHLGGNFRSVRQRLRQIGEDGLHLGTCLEPFLLAVEHAGFVVEEFVCRQAYEAVVCLGIRLVDKMAVVAAYNLDTIPVGDVDKLRLYALLQAVCLVVGAWHCGLVALQFDVVIVAEYTFPPLHGLFGTGCVAGQQQARNFAAEACRAYNQPLAVFGKVCLVDARTEIEAFGPCLGNQLYEVAVAGGVLGKYHQVPACIFFVGTLAHVA